MDIEEVMDERRLRVNGHKSLLERKKDGPGPLMVSDTLCPAVHILGTWAVFFKLLKFRQGSGPEWDNVL